MNFMDYEPGSEYIELRKSDFKDISRFQQFLTFLRVQNTADSVKVPIDSKRLTNQLGINDTRYVPNFIKSLTYIRGSVEQSHG